MVGVCVPPSRQELAERIPIPLQLARPGETQKDNGDGQRKRSCPVDPLFAFHVPDIVRVHA